MGPTRHKDRFLRTSSSSTKATSYSSYGTRLRQQHTTISSLSTLPYETVPELLTATDSNLTSEIDSYMEDIQDIQCPDVIETPESVNCGIIKTETKARNINSDKPILNWKEKYRQIFLDQNLGLEGRGRFWKACTFCSKENPTFRCLDCHAFRGYCQECITRLHQFNISPLHTVQEWRDNRFHPTSFQKLGLRVQLGHPPGMTCLHPAKPKSFFTVIAENGIHKVDVRFCNCAQKVDQNIQLLEIGWWPATTIEPRTAATLACLKQFQLFNLNGSLSAQEYYRSLENMSDPEGVGDIYKEDSGKKSDMVSPDKLKQFITIVREFRHIKLLKRAGRGHNPAGAAETKQGELTVDCRCCPHPDINLPADWDKAPPEEAWKYAKYLAEDANFKQKARARKFDAQDPSLGPGWGTFVNNERYMEHLESAVGRDEINHCVGFAALWNANKKRSKGLRATGIGSIVCARHQCFLPNGTGDLQEGEKYPNMDFMFLSVIATTVLTMLFISYDIACQWSKNLRRRVSSYAPDLQIPSTVNLLFLVPKFHLPVHVKSCWSEFSFNFRKWAGRTDGEGIERVWAWLNRIAFSVSMMSAGGRWDTLDDFCAFNNWRRTLSFEKELLRKMADAIPMAIIHWRAFRSFTEGLREEGGIDVEVWERMIEDWERDMSKPSPYILLDEDLTIAQIKKKLSEEEHQKAVEQNADLSLPEITASSFIIAGIELEENQRALHVLAKRAKASLNKSTELQTKRTSLLKSIQKFRTFQSVYMPGLVPYLNLTAWRENDDVIEKPETMSLFLPSAFPDPVVRGTICNESLAQIEDQLRNAQMIESLANLRRQIRQRSYAGRLKNKNGNGQAYYLRSNTFQSQVDARIRVYQTEYTAARSALLNLRKEREWSTMYQELQPEDIRGISEAAMSKEEAEELKQTRQRAGLTEGEEDIDMESQLPSRIANIELAVGEGHRTLSWIWYVVNKEELNGSTKSVSESLRVEWSKTRARALRWKEELILLEEEMRRAIAYCWWRAKWWDDRVHCRPGMEPHLAEGIYAYAIEHATLERNRAQRWLSSWLAIRERAKVVVERKLGDTEEDVDLPEIVVPYELPEDSDDL